MNIVPALSFYDCDLRKESYFDNRVRKELGITDDLNNFELIIKDPTFDLERRETLPILFPDDNDNICIRVYNLRREIIYYQEKKSDNQLSVSNRTKQFILKRLKIPREWPQENQKYDIPKGAGIYPFFPPSLIRKWENKEKIKTLIATEGYFKAIKGSMHGLDIIGLSSITHYRDRETDQMFKDVIDIIVTCQVENFIILYDGDCRNISLKALSNQIDLVIRPDGFLKATAKIALLLKDYNISVFFQAIESDNIPDNPKGLDDLYISFKDKEDIITEDCLSLSKPPRYFHRIDVTISPKKVYDWFHTTNVNDFYQFHQEQIKDIDFVFKGSKYRWNEERKYCEIIAPREVGEYFRVGDNYYKFVVVPNKNNEDELRIAPRLKTTIQDILQRKEFLRQIPTYEEFCNVPDNVNYQPILKNCFNLYSKFEWEPMEGDCSTILMFIKHIFGFQYELGLDYMQLLYQQPWQLLPILCLVSVENNTGKSTFTKLLKAIFKNNCVNIGNEDLSNQFNFSWAGKLLIVCEESFIEKAAVMEKIKALSTADKILSNRKGKDHSEIDFFGKFVLCSNKEENFIIASKYDERYWVIKVPVVKRDNTDLLKMMKEEIPAFLDFLNNRKLTTKSENRMWFKPELRKTEALQKLIESNKSKIESELEYALKELFIDFGFRAILLTPDAINIVLFNKKYNRSYLAKEIKRLFNPKKYVNENGQEVSHRFYYPKWDEQSDNTINESLKFSGCPFIFKREDFLTPDEIKNIKDYGNYINDYDGKNLQNWVLRLIDEIQFT